MLKKSLFFTLLLLFSYQLSASENEISSLGKNSFSFGGTISSYHTLFPSADRLNAIYLRPYLGYFLETRLELNLSVIYDYEVRKYNYPQETYKNTFNQIGISPGLTYYFSSSKIHPYLGYAASFSRSTMQYYHNNTLNYSSTYGENLSEIFSDLFRFGLLYQITDILFLNSSLSLEFPDALFNAIIDFNADSTVVNMRGFIGLTVVFSSDKSP